MSEFEPRDPHFEERVRHSYDRQSFMTLLGARLSLVAPGAVEIVVGERADLRQQHGFFHAGVTSSIADSAAGYAALTLFEPGTGVLTVEYKVNLLAPGQGDFLIARGDVVRPGKTLTLSKADVFAVTGKKETLIATGLFTMIQRAGLGD